MKDHNRIFELSSHVMLYKLYCSCEMMFDFLIDSGKTIPDWIGETFTQISLTASEFWLDNPNLKSKGKCGEVSFEAQVKIAEKISSHNEELAKIYKELAALSAPATPCSLENTIPTVKTFYMWGSLCMPFIRNLWIMSLLFLTGYIISGYFNAIAPANSFAFQLFLMFSAGLGAYFYSLNTAKKYIVDRTFDNRYITNYYNRIIIGILAGFILANTIDASFFDSQKAQGSSILAAKLTPSLFALLGGFSAQVVVQILNRIVAMFTTLVEGDASALVDNKSQEIKNKFAAERLRQNSAYIDELYNIIDKSSIRNDADTYSKMKDLVKKMYVGN